MSRVLTNNVALNYGIQSALNVDPTVWKQLEPNDITEFGATITKVARRPISKNRQRRKGATTDLDSAVGFEADLTRDSFVDFIEGFVFAEAANTNTVFQGVPVVTAGYTIPAATASQAAKFQFVTTGPKSLVYAKGYTNSINNGLKPLTSDLAAAGVAIPVTGLTAETPPTNAEVSLAGIRAATGDLAIAVSGTTGTLTAGSNGVTGGDRIDFTTLGIRVGQSIHIGGLLVANQFSAGYGYVRIVTITALVLTFDKASVTLVTDTGAGDTVDLLFGRFIRNLSVDDTGTDTQYIERIFMFEATYPDLDSVGVPEYEYPKNNYCDELVINLPLTDLAKIEYGFIGTDTPVPSTTRKAGASTAIAPLRTTAFGTASDIANIRTSAMAASDTYFKSLTLTLANNVSPEKVLGILGAAFMNAGLFEVNLEGQAIFTDSAIIAAIRNNTTVTFDFILRNDDGAIAVDIPSLTFGGGDREYPQDESVLINIPGEAHRDTTLGYSLGVSLFPIVPLAA